MTNGFAITLNDCRTFPLQGKELGKAMFHQMAVGIENITEITRQQEEISAYYVQSNSIEPYETKKPLQLGKAPVYAELSLSLVQTQTKIKSESNSRIKIKLYRVFHLMHWLFSSVWSKYVPFK